MRGGHTHGALGHGPERGVAFGPGLLGGLGRVAHQPGRIGFGQAQQLLGLIRRHHRSLADIFPPVMYQAGDNPSL
ncbi:hypothetical protein ABZ297_18515 [Nonomuraea sp. NPDC005983]|uniref:hypothetical protein n=1 Tax=Nonomuraea sp. NPDC005983 TaxID=3155595 RepID=UPI0033B405CF